MYCPVKKVAFIKELTEMVCQFNNNKRGGILIQYLKLYIYFVIFVIQVSDIVQIPSAGFSAIDSETF